MPEIAEVEVVRRALLKKLLNRTIINININYDKIIKTNIIDFKNNLINQKFIDIKRIGKWLIFETNDYYMLSHLRMEGKYFIKSNNDIINKHEHIIFYLDNLTTLRYHDTRKFGVLKLINKKDLLNDSDIKSLGLEPKDLYLEYLKNKLNSNKKIKNLLLDQSIISGLGNIYVDEVLFSINVNPLTKGKDLTDKDINNLIINSNNIVNKSILEGGCTIKSYTSSLGVIGNYQNYLKVHQREGKKCFNCNSTIIKIKVNGRGTYFCPKCQKYS